MLKLKGISIEIEEISIGCICEGDTQQDNRCDDPDCPICNGDVPAAMGAISIGIGKDGKPTIIGDVPDFLKPVIEHIAEMVTRQAPGDEEAKNAEDKSDEDTSSAEAE